MSSYMCEIVEKVNETHDDFIFTTIAKFCGTNKELSRCVLSKEIILRAMQTFKEEHHDEYIKLVELATSRIWKHERYEEIRKDK